MLHSHSQPQGRFAAFIMSKKVQRKKKILDKARTSSRQVLILPEKER